MHRGGPREDFAEEAEKCRATARSQAFKPLPGSPIRPSMPF